MQVDHDSTLVAKANTITTSRVKVKLPESLINKHLLEKKKLVSIRYAQNEIIP